MQRIAVTLIIGLAISFLGCTTNTDKPTEEVSKLIGKWKLIEQLADPGDGSGTFQPVDSERIFEFFKTTPNGPMPEKKVTVNGVMCYMTTEIGKTTTGSYDETPTNEFSDGEITPPDCHVSGGKIYYKLEGSHLILWYPCIEACGQKFVKI